MFYVHEIRIKWLERKHWIFPHPWRLKVHFLAFSFFTLPKYFFDILIEIRSFMWCRRWCWLWKKFFSPVAVQLLCLIILQRAHEFLSCHCHLSTWAADTFWWSLAGAEVLCSRSNRPDGWALQSGFTWEVEMMQRDFLSAVLLRLRTPKSQYS